MRRNLLTNRRRSNSRKILAPRETLYESRSSSGPTARSIRSAEKHYRQSIQRAPRFQGRRRWAPGLPGLGFVTGEAASHVSTKSRVRCFKQLSLPAFRIRILLSPAFAPSRDTCRDRRVTVCLNHPRSGCTCKRQPRSAPCRGSRCGHGTPHRNSSRFFLDIYLDQLSRVHVVNKSVDGN